MAVESIEPLRVSLLGPTRVWRGSTLVGPAGAKRRALLAMLALEANRPVPADTLVAGLWGEKPPPSAANLVQTYVSAWRRAIEPERQSRRPAHRLRTVGGAYELALAVEECDALRFREAAKSGSAHAAAGRFGAAAADLAAALDLWQGPALADLHTVPFGDVAAGALELRRLAVTEEWAHACLQGRTTAASDVGAALEAILGTDPLRERAVELLMWALSRDGRRAEALRVFDETRRRLSDELGADPGPELRSMHADVLGDAVRLRPLPASEPLHVSRPLPRGDSFVGRGRDLAAVAALLAEHRLVTLTGPGGSGKTRLAEEIAGAAAGSVVFVELAGLRDAAHVAAAVAEAFGLHLGGSDDVLDNLSGRLVDYDALLVLDNLEHLTGVERVVERLIRATNRLRVLATSRHPLGVAAEQRFAVQPLPLPEDDDADPGRLHTAVSVRLLVDRARAADAAFTFDATNAVDLARIATRLDGLPLAIEIAAPWLAVLSPAQLLNRLTHLHSLTSRTGRHATLDSVVGWSFGLLPAQAQRLLLRLSVFRGSASLEAIENVCGPDLETPSLTVLADLVQRSLVEPVTNGIKPRFRLLETVRQYLAEQHAGTGDHAETLARYLDWFAGWTAELALHTEGREAGAWLGEAAADIHNLQAALDASVGTPRELQLAVNCASLWHELGRLREGLIRLERAVATASPDDPARPIGNALLAWLLISVDQDRAHRLARRAVELAERADDPLVHSFTLQVAGYADPDHHPAELTLRAAIAMAEGNAGLPVRYAQTAPEAVRHGAIHGLLLRLNFRDASGAVELCESQLGRAVAKKEPFEIVQGTIQSTLALLRVGRIDDAARLPVIEPHGLTAGGNFYAAIAKGMLAYYRERPAEAAASFDRAWWLSRERGSAYALALAAGWVIDLAADLQEFAEAERTLGEAETLCSSADARIRGMLDVSRARLLRLTGDQTRARQLLNRSAHVIESDELTPTVMVWLVESAVHAAALGDHDESRRYEQMLRARSAATGLVVPPWEERRLAEYADVARRHGLYAL